ncbi:MAG: Rieske (2Fe-2S) protein [Candidatus Bathyarchaeota archaeon]|nr:Rieske (2Fe-2S) protein [Candidatus Bathyarchaeota archaeon]
MSGNDDMFFPALDESELTEGSMKLVRVDGEPVLLIRTKGKIYAIDNRCPHMSCGFSGGALDGDVIICPCHDWRFNLETSEYEEDPDMKLLKYEWKIKAGKIYVKLDEE